MKKIALLADGWKRLITYAWIRGINRFIDKYPERIEVCHYNCMGNWSDDRVFNQGEYNIFHLPDLTMFDGIILDLNNVCDEVQKQHLVDMVRESGVPAISIGSVVTDTDNNMTLQECLNIADQTMYENKRKKKNESMVER